MFIYLYVYLECSIHVPPLRILQKAKLEGCGEYEVSLVIYPHIIDEEIICANEPFVKL